MTKKTLSPSNITAGQVRKLSIQFEDALLKANPFSAEAQDLIENSWDELKNETLAALSKAVKTVLRRKRESIVFKIKVNRSLSVQEMLDATGRKQKIWQSLVDEMPIIPGEGEEVVEFVFFKPASSVRDKDVEAELAKYGLVQDIAAQIQCNVNNPQFATDHPNEAIWKGSDKTARFGNSWCHIYFYCSETSSENVVKVSHSPDVRFYGHWLGGRKIHSSLVS